MAQEVQIAGAIYSNVPSIRVPDSNSVYHSFVDPSDTTATASDVVTGKYFYTSAGIRTEGTRASGGGSAISVIDTTDAAGGTIRTITAVDLSDDTVTAATLLSGYTAHDAMGNAITGQASGGGGTDTSDATMTSGGQMLSGVTAYSQGTKYTGTIQTKTSSDLTASGATVTAPAGYYASSVQKSVSSGSANPAAQITGTGATISTGLGTITLSKTVSNTPQVTAGYVSSGTAGNSAVTLSASATIISGTIHSPSTVSDVIPAGSYITGNQVIEAVTLSNLTAENIKSGVTVKVGSSTDDDCVASVTGTYDGGGGGGSVNIDSKTVTASNYPVSISFTSMKGEPKAFFLRSTSQISSSGSTSYYYIINMRYDGTNTQGNCFRIGSTRRVDPITSGYSWSYSGTTLTITSSASSRSVSPGAFNNGYELVYVY